jgi:hypothetical protein
MTVAEGTDVITLYKKVFALDELAARDYERLNFLELIASGEIQKGEDQFSIAAKTVRDWYENPKNVTYHRVLAKVSEAPECKAVFYNLRECLTVLKDVRLEELFEQYEKALAKRNHDNVDSTERLIQAFEDQEAIKKMNALRTSYIQTRRYKSPKPEGDGPPWYQVLAISLISAGIMIWATKKAFEQENSSKQQITIHQEYEQKADNKQKETDYLATPR